MKRINHLFILLFALAFTVFSCDGQEQSLIDDRLANNPLPGDNTENYHAGDADFSNFVTIGNSLTAGYMDGALYNAGQQNSLGAMLASQLEVVGAPEAFNQPDINSEHGFNTAVEQSQGGPILGRFKLDTSIPGPSPIVGGDPISAYNGNTPDLDNFGVPGILLGQLLTPATGGPQSSQNPAYNPFYARFASNPSPDGANGSTILQDALSAQPTFFTLWIGSNDVLGYAAGGASNESLLTSPGDFDFQFNATINALMSSFQAKGVVITIPPILGTPFFQAIPYNAIPLTEQSQVDALNAAYADYNNGVNQAKLGGAITEEEAQRRQISFALGANAFVMEDETLTDLSAFGLPNLRQTESSDIIVFSAATAFANGVGTQQPAEDHLVLIPSEQVEIETHRAQFNASIASAVSANETRLELYDTNDPGNIFLDLMDPAAPGTHVDGVFLKPDFSPGGIVSTDGIHPNRRGYALIVNDILETIEAGFNAKLPEVDVLNQPSVQICAGNCASQAGGM
ncbi:MAG: hypothetical protein FH748_14135 [Balneolaceae bacterium]|nr:hypothetical protein [Balneolaceae bacterium]